MIMIYRSLAALICVLIICVAYPAFTQTQAPQTQKPNPPQEEEKISIGTNEVLLDAVVRDKKGHAVKDLQASDFEIYEDGVRQEVKSFRLVTRESPMNESVNQTEGQSEKIRS